MYIIGLYLIYIIGLYHTYIYTHDIYTCNVYTLYVHDIYHVIIRDIDTYMDIDLPLVLFLRTILTNANI